MLTIESKMFMMIVHFRDREMIRSDHFHFQEMLQIHWLTMNDLLHSQELVEIDQLTSIDAQAMILISLNLLTI